jgi:hypothetical protein
VVVVSKKYLYAAKWLFTSTVVNINVGGLGTVDCLGMVPKPLSIFCAFYSKLCLLNHTKEYLIKSKK